MLSRCTSPTLERQPQTNYAYQQRKLSLQKGDSRPGPMLGGHVSPSSLLSQQYFPKTPTRLSKDSTRESHLSRRSSLNDVRSPERGMGSPREDPPTMFSMLSHLLQNENGMVQKYREKVDKAKGKISTGFSHLKEEIGAILDRVEMSMCENLNSQYREFISLFDSTKQLVHQLYDEKLRYFEDIQRNILDMTRQQHLENRPVSNDGLLRSIRQQNAQAVYARKYQLFYKEKEEDFAILVARRREIINLLEEDIFNYSTNNSKLRQLKKQTQRLVDSLFSTEITQDKNANHYILS